MNHVIPDAFSHKPEEFWNQICMFTGLLIFLPHGQGRIPCKQLVTRVLQSLQGFFRFLRERAPLPTEREVGYRERPGVAKV